MPRYAQTFIVTVICEKQVDDLTDYLAQRVCTVDGVVDATAAICQPMPMGESKNQPEAPWPSPDYPPTHTVFKL